MTSSNLNHLQRPSSKQHHVGMSLGETISQTLVIQIPPPCEFSHLCRFFIHVGFVLSIFFFKYFYFLKLTNFIHILSINKTSMSYGISYIFFPTHLNKYTIYSSAFQISHHQWYSHLALEIASSAIKSVPTVAYLLPSERLSTQFFKSKQPQPDAFPTPFPVHTLFWLELCSPKIHVLMS